MPATTSVHGHEVIHLLADARPALSRQELATEVARRFGAQARFHTCSVNGLTLDQLLVFLMERNKVVDRDGRLAVNLAEVCDHD